MGNTNFLVITADLSFSCANTVNSRTRERCELDGLFLESSRNLLVKGPDENIK